jgi:hypothetical protein
VHSPGSRTLRRGAITGFALVLLIAALLGYRHFYPPNRFDPERLAQYYRALMPLPSSRPDLRAVEESARLAAGYIRSNNDPSGKFVYLANLDADITVPVDYSILRHEGTVFALGMYDDLFPDRQNVDVMRRAVRFLRECCYQELEGKGAIGIREPDFVADQGGRDYYKLGGAGLGLLALVSVERKSPGFVPQDELEKVGELGHVLQRWDGSFYSNYNPEEGGRSYHNKSLYYPGEMAKGWAAVSALHGDRTRDIEAASQALHYLARTRAREGAAPADHWALLATAQLFEAAGKRGIDIPREALIGHALQICHAMLEDARHPQPIPAMAGSLAPKGAVTPTATRLEGLQAALGFLPSDHPIVPHVNAAVERGIDFLVRAQVKQGRYVGAFPKAIARLPEDGTEATGRFNADATEVRIDYVQHSLSALVQYLQRESSPAQ